MKNLEKINFFKILNFDIAFKKIMKSKLSKDTLQHFKSQKYIF